MHLALLAALSVTPGPARTPPGTPILLTAEISYTIAGRSYRNTTETWWVTPSALNVQLRRPVGGQTFVRRYRLNGADVTWVDPCAAGLDVTLHWLGTPYPVSGRLTSDGRLCAGGKLWGL